jgi:Family of unknown function (DUF6152)
MKSNLKILRVALLCALGLCAAIPAWAHHSMAGFDRTKTVNVSGTVKQFKWANPHSWIELEVANNKGGTDVWNFEMMPPSYLINSGWKSNSIKAGDKVKVTAAPFKDGSPGGLFRNLTLPSGQVLGAGAAPRGAAPYDSGAPARGAAPAPR